MGWAEAGALDVLEFKFVSFSLQRAEKAFEQSSQCGGVLDCCLLPCLTCSNLIALPVVVLRGRLCTQGGSCSAGS